MYKIAVTEIMHSAAHQTRDSSRHTSTSHFTCTIQRDQMQQLINFLKVEFMAEFHRIGSRWIDRVYLMEVAGRCTVQ